MSHVCSLKNAQNNSFDCYGAGAIPLTNFMGHKNQPNLTDVRPPHLMIGDMPVGSLYLAPLSLYFIYYLFLVLLIQD